jgi:DNA-binding CsgD family transcriptional regulator
LALGRTSGDVATVARGLVNLGITLRYRGQIDLAERVLHEALAISEAGDEKRFGAYALDNLGVLALVLGDTELAVTRHDNALRLARENGDAWGSAVALFRRGFALLRAADLGAAARSFRESMALWPEHGDRWTLSESVEGLACLAAARCDWLVAGQLFGAAEGLRLVAAVPLVADWLTFHADGTRAASRALGDAAFAAAYQDGKEWTTDRVIAEASSLTDSTDPSVPANQHGLTKRELEVLRLICEGLSNREIGERLFVAERTAQTHVGNVFAKLDVHSRAEAVDFAHRHGLSGEHDSSAK